MRTMTKRILLCLFSLLPALAFAQSALPHPDPSHPGAASHIVTKNGTGVAFATVALADLPATVTLRASGSYQIET